jgi:hypothetical protein
VLLPHLPVVTALVAAEAGVKEDMQVDTVGNLGTSTTAASPTRVTSSTRTRHQAREPPYTNHPTPYSVPDDPS